MKILITGATGYIGQKLARELTLAGHSVTAITRNKYKLQSLDFPISIIDIDLVTSSLAKLDLNSFDIVYNCAGEIKDESLMHDLHVVATMKLLKRISNNRTRWVQLSSVGVYGNNVTGVVDEATVFSPVGTYEKTKAEAEIKIKSYCKRENIPFVILRPSNVFSLDMPNNSLRQLVGIIQKGLFFYFQDPTNIKANYVHVDNVVQALVQCGLNDRAINNDYIISDSMSLKAFVEAICLASGRKVPKLIVPIRIIRSLASFFSIVPRFPNLHSKINALSVTAEYSSDKIENELGYNNKNLLDTAITEFSLSLLKK